MPSPVPFAAYRAIAQGAVVTPDPGPGSIWRPAARVLLPKPKLTLKLGGLKSGAVTLGRSVTAGGALMPTSLAGSKVALTVQMKSGTRWARVKTASATINAAGAYSWKYKPTKKGAYRVQAEIAGTAAHAAARTAWRTFTVK